MSQKPLDYLLPKNCQWILAAVLMQPGRSWYRSELAGHLGVSPSSLQRPLAALLAAGILQSRRHGNRLYFQANFDSPLYPEIRGLVAKTVGLVGVLREALAPLAAKIAVAFVYGSIARGEEVSTSDVDLFLVGTVGLADLALPLREAQGRLGREVNPSLFAPVEFAKAARARHRFVMGVLDSAKLFVIGTEDDLARVARPKTGRKTAIEPGRAR
jgi:predicted nucleotidyltransferase